MDGQLLAAIQKELRSFRDDQLWALLELTVHEMEERGLFSDDVPLRRSNRPDPDQSAASSSEG